MIPFMFMAKLTLSIPISLKVSTELTIPSFSKHLTSWVSAIPCSSGYVNLPLYFSSWILFYFIFSNFWYPPGCFIITSAVFSDHNLRLFCTPQRDKLTKIKIFANDMKLYLHINYISNCRSYKMAFFDCLLGASLSVSL